MKIKSHVLRNIGLEIQDIGIYSGTRKQTNNNRHPLLYALNDTGEENNVVII